MHKRLLIALPIFLFLVAGVSAAADRHDSTLANPGFEDGGVATASPSGWRSAGDRGADFTEAGGHSGGFHLTHWSAAGRTRSRPRSSYGISHDGWYTLRAWVRGSAGDNDSSIGLDCGHHADERVQVPVSTSQWLQIVVSARVEHGSCTIVLRTKAAGGEWAHFDDVELVPGAARLSILGADVSSLAKSEDKGGVYRDRPRQAGRRPRHPRGRTASTTCGCASGSTRRTATTTRPSCSRWPGGPRRRA